jgi:hypothetical protein
LIRERRRHLEFLGNQSLRLAILESYWLHNEPFGPLLTYCASPSARLRALEELGFRVCCVRGTKHFEEGRSVNLRLPGDAERGHRDSSAAGNVSILSLTVSCAHVHYVVFSAPRDSVC